MHSPIADPHGESNLKAKSATTPQKGVFVRYRPHRADAVRNSLKRGVIEPANIPAILFFPLVGAVMISSTSRSRAWFFEAWIIVFCASLFTTALLMVLVAVLSPVREKTIVLTRDRVFRQDSPHNQVEIEWSRILFVLIWSGDVFLSTFAGSTFISRDVFTSREECDEFVRIARELRRSRGATWREEWNGKTFGSND